MDESTIVELGTYAHSVMTHDHFNTIWAAFEQHNVVQMLSTKPAQAEERERVYSVLSGARAFLDFLSNYADHAQKLTESYELPTSTLADQIDDPSVHDIYR